MTRNPIGHLGFGFGVHRCAGSALAMLEIEPILAALARRAGQIEIVGDPVRTLNDALRRPHSSPVVISQRHGR